MMIPIRARGVWPVLVLAFVGAGCVGAALGELSPAPGPAELASSRGTVLDGMRETVPDPLERLSWALSGAGEDEEFIQPAEVPPPGLPEPQPVVLPTPAPSGRGAALGARAGFLAALGAAESGYTGAMTIGVYCAGDLRLFGRRSIPFEAGFDMGRIESDGGDVGANLYIGRVDLLFRLKQQGTAVCLVAGAGIVSAAIETAVDEKLGEVVSAIDLGVGVGSVEKRWNARLTYSILNGSENLQAFLLLTGGWNF